MCPRLLGFTSSFINFGWSILVFFIWNFGWSVGPVWEGFWIADPELEQTNSDPQKGSGSPSAPPRSALPARPFGAAPIGADGGALPNGVLGFETSILSPIINVHLNIFPVKTLSLARITNISSSN